MSTLAEDLSAFLDRRTARGRKLTADAAVGRIKTPEEFAMRKMDIVRQDEEELEVFIAAHPELSDDDRLYMRGILADFKKDVIACNVEELS